MKQIDFLNPLAKRVWVRLSSKHPEWQEYLGTRGENDLEVAIPAPPRSKAGRLVIFTDGGKHLWVRYSPPYMCYLLDDEEETLSIVQQLLTENAVFVVIMKGDAWAETTLIRPGQEPCLEAGQVAHVVSWSGIHDKIVSAEVPRL